MNAIKFRYTFRETPPKNDVLTIIANFVRITEPVYVTSGYETLNSLGETTHPHIHIHITTDKTIGTVRKAVQRYLSSFDESDTRKGNAKYSCVEEKDVLDMERFLRYSWKQGGREAFREKLPDGMNTECNLHSAREEYQRLVEFNRKKREKQQSPSTFDKIEEYLKDKEFESLEDIACHIDEFYLQKELSMNIATMSGYVLTYARKKGLLSKQEIVQKILSKI